MSNKLQKLHEAEGEMEGEDPKSGFIYFLPELISLLVAFAQIFEDATISLYIMYSSCQKLYPYKTDCASDLDNHEIQETSADYLLLNRLILQIPILIILPLFGSLSDTIGNKVLVMISATGCTMGSLLYLISTLEPSKYIYLVVFGSFLRGLVCKSDFIIAAITTIAVQTTPEEKRTSKLSWVLSTKYVGNTIGFVLQGVLLGNSNYRCLFLLCIGTYLTITLLALLFISDNIQKSSSQQFVLKHYVESLKVLTKKPTGGTLFALWCVMSIMFIQKSVASCEKEIAVLYINKNIPSFPASGFSWFWMTQKLGSFIMVTIVLSLAKKVGIKDTWLCLFAAVAMVTSFSLLSMTHSVSLLYIAICIGSSSTLFVPTTKSFISGIVSKENYGKAFSLYFGFESLANILGPLVYINIYSITINFYSGTAYLSMAASYLILFFVALYLTFSLQPTEKLSKGDAKDINDETKDIIDKPSSQDNYGASEEKKFTSDN